MRGWTRALLVLLAACGAEKQTLQTPAEAPVPKDPPWLADAAAACARELSCTRTQDPDACISSWLSAPPTLEACIRDAKSCSDVEECRTGAGDAKTASFCGKRTGVVAGCEGNRLISCGDERTASFVMDCAALGATCREERAATGIVIRACFSADRCPANAPEARCDGETAVIGCHDGAIEKTACSAGTSCRERTDENGDPTASCVLTRGSCSLFGSRGCDGDRLVECTRGHPAVTDCRAAGLRCVGNGPRARCSVSANIECDRERLPSCDGEALVICAAGRLERVSCASIGMGPCSPSLAACSPKATP